MLWIWGPAWAKAEGVVGIPWLMSWLCLWGVFSHQDWRSHVWSRKGKFTAHGCKVGHQTWTSWGQARRRKSLNLGIWEKVPEEGGGLGWPNETGQAQWVGVSVGSTDLPQRSLVAKEPTSDHRVCREPEILTFPL